MTIFEHLSVLLSLILSLGIASLLLGVARLMQEWRRVVFSWPHALWTVVIFLTQLLFWLYAYTFHTVVKTSLIGMMIPLAMSITVFLQGALVTPYIPEAGPIDLRAFHASRRFQYLGAMILYDLLFIAMSLHMATFMQIQIWSYVIPVFFIVTTLSALSFKTQWIQVAAAGSQILIQLLSFSQVVDTINRI
jgi:hypothetical protein